MNTTLFKDEKKVFYRLSNGRFATKEMAFADKQRKDNEILRYEVEKYRRMYLAVVNENRMLKEKIGKIKGIVNNI